MGAAISIPPTSRRSPVQQAFDRVGDELVAIRRELLASAPQVADYVVDQWVVDQTRRCIREMRGGLEGRRQQALNYIAGFDGERAEDRGARHQAFFMAVDPDLLEQELKSKELPDSVWATYSHAMGELERCSAYGRMLARYRLPEKVVKELVSQALEPISAAEPAFRAHERQVEANRDYIRGLSAGVGDVSQDTERALRQVHATFERICAAVTEARRNVEKNLRLVFMALYAGSVARFASDVSALGRELVAIDYDAPLLQVKLNVTERTTFRNWADDVVERLRALEAAGEWVELAATSSQALEYTVRDPARRADKSPDDTVAYAVHFARARARALNHEADAAWQRGDVLAAALLYRALLDGVNLAWELGAGKTPASESTAIAGMRLALVCSSKVGRRVPSPEAGVGALVAHVQQALLRLAENAPERCVAGEGIDPQSVACARVLAAYCSHAEIPLIPPSGLPATLQAKVAELGWTEASAAPLLAETRALVKQIGGVGVQDSRLLAWLSSNVNRRRRHRLLRALKWAAIAVPLLSLAVWTHMMWPSWKAEYFPTRIAGQVTPPQEVEPGPSWQTLFTHLTPSQHLTYAQRLWFEASKLKEKPPLARLDEPRRHLKAIPLHAPEAESALRLLARIEERYIDARTEFVSNLKLPDMGGRYSLRLMGVEKRELRISSTKCDEQSVKGVVDEFGGKLNQLGFTEIHCDQWGKSTWKHEL